MAQQWLHNAIIGVAFGIEISARYAEDNSLFGGIPIRQLNSKVVYRLNCGLSKYPDEVTKVYNVGAGVLNTHFPFRQITFIPNKWLTSGAR